MRPCPTCGLADPLSGETPVCSCGTAFAPNETRARQIVRARSGGICELDGTSRASEWAHRLGRGQGGLWLPSNGVDLCNRCHAWTHHEPTLADLGGWRIESTGEHPATVPVWLRVWLGPGWYLLDDEVGGYDRLYDRDDVPTLPPWVTAGSGPPRLGSRS